MFLSTFALVLIVIVCPYGQGNQKRKSVDKGEGRDQNMPKMCGQPLWIAP